MRLYSIWRTQCLPPRRPWRGPWCDRRSTAETLPRFKIFVRVNAVTTGLLPDDLDSVVCRELFGIVLPKVEDPEGLQTAQLLLEEREERLGLPAGHTRILPIIETVRGVLGLPGIAVHNPRLIGISYGAEDFATDLGVERTREGIEGQLPRAQIALHAHLIGVTPVDSVFSDVNDDEGLESDTRLAKQLGFKGKFLIHPKQIETANRYFSPSAKEIEYAKQVVATYEEAEARGEASVTLNGKMIDIPIVERARTLLAMAEKVAASR